MLYMIFQYGWEPVLIQRILFSFYWKSIWKIKSKNAKSLSNPIYLSGIVEQLNMCEKHFLSKNLTFKKNVN